MSETRREFGRRTREGYFDKYFFGHGIDIGCGSDLDANDKLDATTASCDRWDVSSGHGDATYMHGVPDEKYDWVASSHLLEHIRDRETALKNWWRILKPGGWLVIMVPHRNLYEQRRTLPSSGNGDHKTFIMPWADEAPDTVGFVPLLLRALEGATIHSVRLCFPYGIEAVIEKRTYPLPPEGTPWVQK